jgi:hypothetical protein
VNGTSTFGSFCGRARRPVAAAFCKIVEHVDGSLGQSSTGGGVKNLDAFHGFAAKHRTDRFVQLDLIRRTYIKPGISMLRVLR